MASKDRPSSSAASLRGSTRRGASASAAAAEHAAEGAGDDEDDETTTTWKAELESIMNGTPRLLTAFRRLRERCACRWRCDVQSYLPSQARTLHSSRRSSRMNRR